MDHRESWGRKTGWRGLVAVTLLLGLFLQAMGHARAASITFDEGPHLAIGYVTLRTGDLRLQPVHIHPPLANVMAAAPLLLQDDLPDPRSVAGWDSASLSGVTDAVVWQYPHPRRLAVAARLPIILMALLLGAVVFRWAGDLFGPSAGLVALGLYAFDPNVIAHGSLVTTDVAVVLWGTSALFLTARYLRRSRWAYLARAGVALGLALASKVSAASLIPVAGLLWLVGPQGLSWRRRFLATAGGCALAALVLWAAYGFEVRALSGFPLPVPAATHVEIYRSLQEHYRLGHPAFLIGQNSEHGWWTYFPVAFALKTPLLTLLLSAVSLGVGVGWIIRRRSLILFPAMVIRRWGSLLLFPLIYLASSFFSSVNIGYRHLLPVLLLLFIAVAGAVSRLAYLMRCTTGLVYHSSRIAYCVLPIVYALATLRSAPHYLAYFNALAGGSKNGYRYLVDSNLDWGQNLWQLRDWMADNGVEGVRYAHFSPARPQTYGIAADFLPPDPRAIPFAPLEPAPGVYAIGATVLQGVYTPDVNTYAWFRAREPVAILGHALFVYRVPARPQPAWAAVCAAPAPVLSPVEVRARMGQPDLRVMLFDCERSWVYTAGERPGRYVSLPGVEPLPGAVPVVQARHPDGEPYYDVYDLLEPVQPEHPLPVGLDGPLSFLGYRVTRAGVYAGEMVELWTFWEVAAVPSRPLSLMAHLVGPDGTPIAVGDGLGVPVDQWQPGDVIVQRHLLEVPQGTAEGEYGLQTGAYWLDTMGRWGVVDGGDAPRNSIALYEVVVLGDGRAGQ